jgi:hypothetical protein
MAAVVRAVLDGIGWQYDQVDPEIFRAPVQSESGAGWLCLIRLSEDDGLCAVYAVHTERVPEDKRVEAATALAGLNYDLSIGAFELDLSDGELRARVGLHLDDEPLTASAFRRLLEDSLALADMHWSTLDGLV